jgi:hypothetical protein
MGKLNIDLTDVKTGGFEALAKGWKHVRVVDYEMKESGENAKHPGAQYLAWEFEVIGGDEDGRKIWTNTSLLPQALFALKGLADACEVEYDEDGIDPDEIVGKECMLKNSHRMYEGEAQNNVKAFKKVGEIAPTPIGGDDSSGGGSLLP